MRTCGNLNWVCPSEECGVTAPAEDWRSTEGYFPAGGDEQPVLARAGRGG